MAIKRRLGLCYGTTGVRCDDLLSPCGPYKVSSTYHAILYTPGGLPQHAFHLQTPYHSTIYCYHYFRRVCFHTPHPSALTYTHADHKPIHIAIQRHHGRLNTFRPSGTAREGGQQHRGQLVQRQTLAAFMGDRKSGGPISTVQLRLWRTRTRTAAGTTTRIDSGDHSFVSTASHPRLPAAGEVHPRTGTTTTGAGVSATWHHPDTAIPSHCS